MIKNYLKIAWRGIVKRKFYSLLNIAGLGLAMACCLLIYLYNSYQLSFDTYHNKADNIFRIVYELHLQKNEYDKSGSYAMYNTMKSGASQLDGAAMSISNQSFTITLNDGQKRFKEDKNIAFADENWFSMFSYDWLQGNAIQLNEPNTAALTEHQSHKYFGTESPVGKIIQVDDKPVKIVGLIADAPYNTDMRSDMYISLSSFATLVPKVEKSFFTDWGYLNSTNNVFLRLKNINQRAQIETRLDAITKQKFGPVGAAHYSFKLLPLKDIHFDTRYGAVIQKSLLVTLSVIGLLILIIAGINYVNLTVAQQTRRSVEIGTRKVLGGSSGQLFMQFMTESVLNSIFATTIAVVIMAAVLPWVNQLLFADYPVHIISYPNLIAFTSLLFLIVTIGAGIYPALLLSRINVFKALKNNIWNLPIGISRKVLIVLQNTVAQVLIACTIIIVMQVHFLTNTDKGFDRKFVVMVPVTDATDLQKTQMTQVLSTMPGVTSFTYCRKSPSADTHMGATVQYNDKPKWETWPARFAIGDSAYCRTFGLQIVSGRNIRNKQPKPELLVNQTMASMLSKNNPDDVIGKDLAAGDTKGIIVGIVKDFAVKSLLEPIEPSVVLESAYDQYNLGIKLSGSRASATLADLQTKYTGIFPNKVFTYQFVDDQIAALYKTEILQQKLIWAAAIVAIFISSLGLLGLISLIILQRTKEIGIRKVLGASASQISLLLSSDFLIMVFIAVTIATPASWWAMHHWLQGFAYRVDISWWVFAITALFSLLIAFITVSFQSVKAAMANPAQSLRTGE